MTEPYAQDDYIENETELDRFRLPLLPCYKMATPFTREEKLALRLEMQEEIDFQVRAEKEQMAILKVKQMITQQLERKTQELEAIKKSDVPVDTFIEYYLTKGFFLKRSPREKNLIRAELNNSNFLEGIQSEITWAKNLLEKINQNIPYLAEALYMDIDRANAIDKKNKAQMQFKFLDAALDYTDSMLAILFPFLTEEFDCFLKYCKKMPSSYIDDSKLTLEQVKENNALALQLIPAQLATSFGLVTKLKNRIEAYCVPLPDGVKSVEAILLQNMAQLISLYKINKQSSRDFVKYYNTREKRGPVEVHFLPYWQETRSEFREIYFCIKQLEELNGVLDDLDTRNTVVAECKMPPFALNTPTKQDGVKESVEIIPKLDSIFVPPLKNSEALLSQTAQAKEFEQFIEHKKIQLQLWQQRIQQRKDQVACMQALLREPPQPVIEKTDNMDVEQAAQLLSIVDRIDNRVLFESFFKADSECKPHTRSFREIEAFIRQVGGSLSQSSGSHFSIQLPNTYLNSAPAPTTTGGSYRPHGGEEWTLSAHKLCRDPFIKAGITPERIEMAQKMSLRPQGVDGDSPKRAFKA